MDQDLSNLMDGDQSTFYQPPDEPNNPTIGSDVILNFEFPQIPDNATIEQIIIGAGVHLSDSDGLFDRGYGVTPYSRNDLTEFLDLDIGPGIEGVFIISPATPIFPVVPNIATVQTPVGTVFEISIDLADLTLENARNLSVAVQGINDAGTVFDRVSEIYATVIYSFPDPPPVRNVPTLSEWGLIAMASILGIVGLIIMRRRKVAA